MDELDPKCEELARKILPNGTDPTFVFRLGIEIQDAIDDWMQDMAVEIDASSRIVTFKADVKNHLKFDVFVQLSGDTPKSAWLSRKYIDMRAVDDTYNISMPFWLAEIKGLI